MSRQRASGSVLPQPGHADRHRPRGAGVALLAVLSLVAMTLTSTTGVSSQEVEEVDRPADSAVALFDESAQRVEPNTSDSRVDSGNTRLVKLSQTVTDWLESDLKSGAIQTVSYSEAGATNLTVVDTERGADGYWSVRLDLATEKGEPVGWARAWSHSEKSGERLWRLEITDFRLGHVLVIEPTTHSGLSRNAIPGVHVVAEVRDQTEFTGYDEDDLNSVGGSEVPLKDIPGLEAVAEAPAIEDAGDAPVVAPRGSAGIVVGNDTVVDVAVAFTQGGKDEAIAGSPGTNISIYSRNLIDRVEDEFQLTNPDLELRLVHVRQLTAAQAPTNEANTIYTSEEAAGEHGSTNYRNIIQFVRNSSGADIVITLTDDYVGQGAPGFGPTTGYVTAREPIFRAGQVGLLHEVSHVFGAHHRYSNEQTCVERPTTNRGYNFIIWQSNWSSAHNGPFCPTANTPASVLSGPSSVWAGVTTGNSTHDNVGAVEDGEARVSGHHSGYFCSDDGTAHVGFIRNRFRELTGRLPNSTEENFYKGQMEAGWRPVDTVRAMLNVGDARNRQHPVQSLYEIFFNRPGDRNGVRFWTAETYTRTWDNIAANFEFSNEGIALHGNRSNEGFVTFVYQTAYERAPDAGGMAYWLDRLDSGTITRGGLVLSFAFSPEAAGRLRTRNEAVSAYYAVTRGTPTSYGADQWETHFANHGQWSGVMSLMSSGSC